MNGPTKGKIEELIHELMDIMEKHMFYSDFDIKLYKMEGTRLGMGRGDHQLGRQPGAFLAGAFFFSEITRPFSKKTSFGCFPVN